MKYSTIFFDLDGTLTDPALGITNSVIYALKKAGFPYGSNRDYYSWIGPPLIESFQKYCGVGKEKAFELTCLYREYYSEKGLFENEIYPGIRELLLELKNTGSRLVVATGKPTVFSKRIVDKFGILSYFDNISGTELNDHPLDKHGVICEGARLAGLNSFDGCIMVGDREHDVIGAKQCGMSCVGVLYGYGSKSELEHSGAFITVDTVEELYGILL